ncbi:hypothetical protein L1887_18905 [Cichorium endivia]|nr:hypothetical protein L1887_18905 [Cichorium endivia]
MSPAREISSEAETNTIERVIGTADPASIGAGAGADENSAYSLATAAVEEMTRTKRATIAALSAPPEAIFRQMNLFSEKTRRERVRVDDKEEVI